LPSQVKSNAKKQGETVTAIIKATEVMIQWIEACSLKLKIQQNLT